MLVRSVGLATAVLALGTGLASAHGSHSNESPSSDWATRHMQGEREFNSIWDPPVIWLICGTPN